MQYQEGELVLTDCPANLAHMDYPDFVVKLEGRFLPEIKGVAWWSIFFRDTGGPYYMFSVKSDGSVWLGGFERDLDFPSAAFAGYETNQIMVIAKGSEFAFYVNQEPLYYINDRQIRWGDISIKAWSDNDKFEFPTRVAFDNFEIWDIGDIPVP